MNYQDNAAIVKKYLDENDWHYHEHDRENAVLYETGLAGFGKHGGLYDAYKIAVLVGEDAVQTFAQMPAPAGTHLAEVAEYIARANYGLKFGNFDLDFNDGEVRYHLAYPASVLQGDVQSALDFLMQCGVTMLHNYARGYMKVVMGDATPAEAIAEAES